MTVDRLVLVVPGDPVPLERARVGRGRHYLPARSRAYRELVQGCWLEAGSPSLGDAPFTVSAAFHVARPAAHYGTGCNAQTLKPSAAGAVPGGDIDNLTKGVLDALTGLAFTDDRQAICLSGVHKFWAAPGEARTEVTLWVAA
jgi:Holliday junction resolvase RusA-like endonuclease